MFSRKHTPKISYASLIKFLAGAFVLGSIWGPFGVHLGSMWAVGEQSELVTPSGEQFDPPWTDLGAFLDPMLAPCWRPLDVLGHLGAFLERSGAHLEAIFDQHRTEGEKKRLDFRKTSKTCGLCLFFEVPEVPT